jgi:hypothetical protein
MANDEIVVDKLEQFKADNPQGQYKWVNKGLAGDNGIGDQAYFDTHVTAKVKQFAPSTIEFGYKERFDDICKYIIGLKEDKIVDWGGKFSELTNKLKLLEDTNCYLQYKDEIIALNELVIDKERVPENFISILNKCVEQRIADE